MSRSPLLAFALTIALAACASSQPLAGTELDGRTAPDLTLQDGLSGQSLTLSSLRGKVVVLSFLYTQCPDTCPLTAELLSAAQRALGTDAERVELVAISVDPARDTPQAIRAFSDAHRLTRSWHYLIGRREQLEPIWSAYGIRAEGDQGGPTVTHTDALFVIDATGRERRLLRTDVGPDAVAAAIRAILK